MTFFLTATCWLLIRKLLKGFWMKDELKKFIYNISNKIISGISSNLVRDMLSVLSSLNLMKGGLNSLISNHLVLCKLEDDLFFSIKK